MRISLSLPGNGSVKISLSLLGNGSVKMLQRQLALTTTEELLDG
jgi:hypothetical protein